MLLLLWCLPGACRDTVYNTSSTVVGADDAYSEDSDESEISDDDGGRPDYMENGESTGRGEEFDAMLKRMEQRALSGFDPGEVNQQHARSSFSATSRPSLGLAVNQHPPSSPSSQPPATNSTKLSPTQVAQQHKSSSFSAPMRLRPQTPAVTSHIESFDEVRKIVANNFSCFT